jgi:Protein of unknown function (DUF2752)
MQPNPAAHAAGQGGPHVVRRHRRYIAAGTGVAAAGALGYVGLVDPHNPHSAYPLCPFKWLTGWNCPFCGGLRMTHDLLHGHLMAGVSDNVFLLVGIPMLAAWLLLRLGRGKTSLPTPALLAVVVATIAWTVLRNLPAFPLFPTVLGD